MAINLVTKYLPFLEEKFAWESRTSILDYNNALIRDTADAKTVMLAQISMNGLSDYSRTSGFTNNAVNLVWKSYTFAYDRGTEMSIDTMDNAETLGVLFANSASEFLRTKVVPEVDAIRFATYAQKQGYTVADADLTSSTTVDAIDAGFDAMENNEAPIDEAVLFVTPAIYRNIVNSSKFVRNLAPSENPNRNFGEYDGHPVIKVPQNRFYSKITLNDGTTSGQTAGGYVKASDGKDINFAIICKSSVVQIQKHAVLREFAPNENQKADAWLIQYRVYHDAWVIDNRDEGVYVSCADEDD